MRFRLLFPKHAATLLNYKHLSFTDMTYKRPGVTGSLEDCNVVAIEVELEKEGNLPMDWITQAWVIYELQADGTSRPVKFDTHAVGDVEVSEVRELLLGSAIHREYQLKQPSVTEQHTLLVFAGEVMRSRAMLSMGMYTDELADFHARSVTLKIEGAEEGEKIPLCLLLVPSARGVRSLPLTLRQFAVLVVETHNRICDVPYKVSPIFESLGYSHEMVIELVQPHIADMRPYEGRLEKQRG